MIKATCILPNTLYQRSEFRQFSLDKKLAMLERYNIGLVVNLTTDRDDPELIQSPDVLYIRVPLKDSKVQKDFRQVEIAVKEALIYIRNYERAVLAHCYGGRNRSSLFTARMLMELSGVTGEEAVEAVRLKIPKALSNPAFLDYLLMYNNSKQGG